MPHISELRDRVLAAVDATFAETVGLYFLKAGATDPTRTNATITAPLRVGSEETPTAGRGTSWSTRIASGEAEMRVDYEVWPAAALIRQGDKVRAMDRPGRPWFEVANVDDRSAPRLIVHLREA